MRAVLFEGTPEEFARVEAVFRAGGDPTVQTRSIVLPQSRPKAWPELGEEHCYLLATRVLEIMPARARDALEWLAEVQSNHGEHTIEEWSEYAGRLPEELCGYLAELGRCASRAFIELYGCDNAPQRVKGAAAMLLQKVRSEEGAYFVVRPGLMRAMAERDLLDLVPPALEQRAGTARTSEPRSATGAPSPSPTKAPPAAAMLPPPSRPLAVATPKPSSAPETAGAATPPPHGPPGGILSEVARLLSPWADSARSGALATPTAATGNPPPAPAAKRERNPFSLLEWADPD